MHLAHNIRRPRRVAVTLIGLLAVLAGALAPGSAAAATPNSADGIITWTGCNDLLTLTDGELDTWKSRGVDGFACVVGHLRGMGGAQDFTGDPAASLTGANYSLQRRFRDTDIVGRLRARGMKGYLGAYLVNYYNSATPLAEWFDDAGWGSKVLPKVGDLAAAAKRLGFAGLAFDHELYPQEGAHTASWSWRYPGYTRTEAATRAKAKERGRQLMGAMVDRFPGLELLTYGVEFPESWNEVVQKDYNGVANAFADRLDIDFYDGVTSAEGYGALRIMDATFYKNAVPGKLGERLPVPLQPQPRHALAAALELGLRVLTPRDLAVQLDRPGQRVQLRLGGGRFSVLRGRATAGVPEVGHGRRVRRLLLRRAPLLRLLALRAGHADGEHTGRGGLAGAGPVRELRGPHGRGIEDRGHDRGQPGRARGPLEDG